MRRTGADTVWSLFERAAGGTLLEVEPGCVRASLPWETVRGRAAAIAAQLAARGARKSDRIAILAPNSADVVACLGAVAKIGAIAVDLNTALTSWELSFQLAETEPRVVLASPELAGTLGDALARAGTEPAARLLLGGEGDWEPLAPGVADADEGQVAAKAGDPYLLLYTSGTSGTPKGVLHSHRGVVEEAARMAEAWSIRPDDVVFGHFPLFHVSGLLDLFFPGLLRGATVALGKRFSASRWVDEARLVGATVAPMVGSQIRMLMAQPAGDDAVPDIRLVPYGISVPEAMEQAFLVRFGTGPLCAMSGSTECLGACYLEPAYTTHRWPSLGRPAADREVRVVDEEGRPLGPGEVGELCVRGEPGAALMLGYWRQPAATAAAVVDGWYHTGDLGWLDEDAFVFFADRIKDVIKRSGENISSSEVEATIAALEGVDEVAVVGRPDPIRDEAVVAFVSVTSAELTPEAIRAFCAERLAAYKVPEEIRLVRDFPRTSIGKIAKKELREAALAPATPTP